MQPLHYATFRKGAILTSAVGIALLLLSAWLGRKECFLLFNADLGRVADYFFRFWTNLGDGFIWVAVFLLFLVYRRKNLPLLISAIVWSTLIAQGVKNFIFPGEPRPVTAFTNHSLLHTVPGVELHAVNSFPSGHTTTAFSIFLLLCLVIPRKWVLATAFIAALLVGYSRIYLAQHFPADVAGGMIAAVISVLLSVPVQQRFDKKAG